MTADHLTKTSETQSERLERESATVAANAANIYEEQEKREMHSSEMNRNPSTSISADSVVDAHMACQHDEDEKSARDEYIGKKAEAADKNYGNNNIAIGSNPTSENNSNNSGSTDNNGGGGDNSAPRSDNSYYSVGGKVTTEKRGIIRTPNRAIQRQVESLISRWEAGKVDANISNGRNFYHDKNNGRVDMQSKCTNKPKYNIQVQVGNSTYSCIIIPYNVDLGCDNIKDAFRLSLSEVRNIELDYTTPPRLERAYKIGILKKSLTFYKDEYAKLRNIINNAVQSRNNHVRTSLRVTTGILTLGIAELGAASVGGYESHGLKRIDTPDYYCCDYITIVNDTFCPSKIVESMRKTKNFDYITKNKVRVIIRGGTDCSECLDHLQYIVSNLQLLIDNDNYAIWTYIGIKAYHNHKKIILMF